MSDDVDAEIDLDEIGLIEQLDELEADISCRLSEIETLQLEVEELKARVEELEAQLK